MNTYLLKALCFWLTVAAVCAGEPGDHSHPKPETCVEGEVWKECVGSSCAELTCKDPVASNGCTLDCNYGCYCADGLYRDVKKNCVRIEQCS
ncbi:cysteine-rich venom protein 6-like [Ixodes scapularis]|uniref:cysteine-rich venom protein 6-like n=1 Tax=Ixodes scapularis TaxID=6945 RepID=UPI0011617BE2|nr:cysteine-rich venom protein 6-like [Ixodes scapularis]